MSILIFLTVVYCWKFFTHKLVTGQPYIRFQFNSFPIFCMDLVGSWSLPTAVSVDETCILGVSQEGEKKSYPLLIKVSFKVAQVLAVHSGWSRCIWKISSMRYIMSVDLLVCGCTNASLDFSEKFCFHAAFHRFLNMRCGSNVNVFFLTHFSLFFL